MAFSPQYSPLEPFNQEQVIYDHFLECVRTESAPQLLNRFHSLFILGQRYPNSYIRETLNDILTKTDNVQDLILFLNRCCYILVNHWQMNPADKGAIIELLSLIDQVKTPGSTTRSYGRGANHRLRSLVYQFCQSKYGLQLRRIAEFVRDKTKPSQEEPLITLIDRYPYLYRHCLTSSHEDPAQARLIHQAQTQAQQKFEQNLSRYMAFSTLSRGKSPLPEDQLVLNPTLLSPQDLHASLKHFVGPSTCKGSYREMSKGFIQTLDNQIKFKDFKTNLYDYVTQDLDKNYRKCRFNQQLGEYLDAISPEHHQKPLTPILKTRTYSRLMNFLVIESRQAPRHSVFMDLISNVGSTSTVGLLLKLVLLETSVKASLERRLGVLFHHYETKQQSSVQWLVRCFEKVNLALTSHFGNLDLSYLRIL